MLVLCTIKESVFTLEICQSQYQKQFYFAVLINISKVVWTQAFDNTQLAEQKGKAMLKAVCLTSKYLDLSERNYQKALFAQEDGELKEAVVFLKRAFFYKQRYFVRRIMGLYVE